MSREVTPRQALMVLNGLPKIGPVSMRRLFERFGDDPIRVLNAKASDLTSVTGVGGAIARTIGDWELHFDLEREEELLARHGVEFVTMLDSDYPALLTETYDPPIGLYFKGDYRPSDPCVSLVGTRGPTLYGRGIAKRLAGDLARLGFCVVSGMARGIDSESHAGALDANGLTIAVLGCGLDIIYPPENLDLYRRIAKFGAIISEFPFGRRADRQSFPMRNRVVSALSLATVVIESGDHGGSMITARFAGEQGRQVFAVPGRIDQRTSSGCHRLIRDGATLLTSVDELVEELNFGGQLHLNLGTREPSEAERDSLSTANLDETESAISKCFSDGAILHLDAIAELTEFPVPQVTATLMMLELKGVVAKRADGAFERR
jgi:DNA processing protein